MALAIAMSPGGGYIVSADPRAFFVYPQPYVRVPRSKWEAYMRATCGLDRDDLEDLIFQHGETRWCGVWIPVDEYEQIIADEDARQDLEWCEVGA